MQRLPCPDLRTPKHGPGKAEFATGSRKEYRSFWNKSCRRMLWILWFQHKTNEYVLNKVLSLINTLSQNLQRLDCSGFDRVVLSPAVLKILKDGARWTWPNSHRSKWQAGNAKPLFSSFPHDFPKTISLTTDITHQYITHQYTSLESSASSLSQVLLLLLRLPATFN